MKLTDFGVNWFDFVALGMVIAGLMVGRKRGMSGEFLDVIQWLLIVFLGGMSCGPFGSLLAQVTGLNTTFCFISAYLMVGTLIYLTFCVLKRMAGDKLVGSDVFGRSEYYLGVLAGGIRFTCILIFLLALFNAPQISDAKLQAKIRAQNQDLGAIYFPPYGSIQRSVFNNSFTGRLIRDNLSAQMINVDPSASSGPSRETLAHAREREVYDVMTPTR